MVVQSEPALGAARWCESGNLAARDQVNVLNAQGVTGAQDGAYIVTMVHGLDSASHVAEALVESLF